MTPELREKAMEGSQNLHLQAMAKPGTMRIHKRVGQAKIHWGNRSSP